MSKSQQYEPARRRRSQGRNPVLNFSGSGNRLQSMADDSSTEKFRLFIAIPIPEPVRDEIIRVQQEMQTLAPRGAARWTPAGSISSHAPVSGRCSRDGLEQLKESVNAICLNARPLANAR